MREYLLVDQDAYRVESYTQTGQDAWALQTDERLDTAIALPRLNLFLPLADLYDRVAL